jgi:hypothetical protein
MRVLHIIEQLARDYATEHGMLRVVRARRSTSMHKPLRVVRNSKSASTALREAKTMTTSRLSLPMLGETA